MESFFRQLKRAGCRLRMLLPGLLLFLPVHGALAIDGTFDNTEGWVNGTQPIQATNFVNEAVFSFNSVNSSSWLASLYHNWQYTRNYTNTINGEMDCNTGFYFDTYTPQNGDVEAASFYNAGPINCGVNNSLFIYFYNVSPYFYGGFGGIDVWATNIYNGGNISIGVDGMAAFTGDNITFSDGYVSLESASVGLGALVQFASPNISATGGTGVNTNDWFPSFELGPTYAFSAIMNGTPFALDLFNSAPYFDIQQTSPTNFIVRMIFLQDTSVNVATNVYFNNYFGDGLAHVEWIGTYTDPASGQPVTHYLYLDDNYVAGSATNILKYGATGTGVPNNYSIYTTTVQQPEGIPTTSGYYYGLISPGDFSNNIYSYVNAQLVATDVPTNEVLHGYPFYLPGRVQISASKGLNLSHTSVSGMNYLLLNSTNEFDSDGQSVFPAPYADMYLGHTNGTMNITNVVASAIPLWSGTVQAWSSRWFYTDPSNVISNPYLPFNNTNAVRYDFRVLLVASQLNPSTAPQLGTFQLFSSNNVVISDVVNVNSNLFFTCTNLLLTTNGIGAASPDGELNLSVPTFLWASGTPRLRCLTNNGAIRLPSLTANVFGGAALPYLAMVNAGYIYNGAGSAINSLDFENYGTFITGSGKFTVQSLNTTMINATVLATNDVFSVTASSLLINNTAIQAGRSLTLQATNVLTDNGVTSSNFWSLGEGFLGLGFNNQSGLTLPILPPTGDLLGTTITNIAVPGIKITDTWAGQDRGYSVTGFQNNEAVGQLVLDGQTNNSKFYFTGTGTSNAIYVDRVQLDGSSDWNSHIGTLVPSLLFNTNLVIYYADAVSDGQDVSVKLNGSNTNHLRWMPMYAGYFSSTNMVYGGTTNAINVALAGRNNVDSDGDGILNNVDSSPVFVSSQVNFQLLLTNEPPLTALITWDSIPSATNIVSYRTNLALGNWLVLTQFVSPATVPPVGGWPITNALMVAVTNSPSTSYFYRVVVDPNTTLLYGSGF